MTCDTINDWLGDAVEGTLDGQRRAQFDAHCNRCAACRELFVDVKEIRAAAAALDRHTPSPELWNAIVARVEHETPATSLRGRSRWGSTWGALAAAAALMIMLGAAAWFAAGVRWQRANDTATADLVRNAASELQLAEQHYQNAITALEQLTVEKDNALDPSVAAEIAESLTSIDRAIDDSRAALKTDPNSFVAQTSLLEALRMKVALLQETVSLMNARS